MSIRPVEFSGVVQRSQDVSALKQNEDNKSMLQQQNVQTQFARTPCTICNRLPMPMILTTPKKNLMPVKKEAMNMKAAIIKRKRRKKKIVER